MFYKTDNLKGLYKNSSKTIVIKLDEKGNGIYKNSAERVTYLFTYEENGSILEISNFGVYNDNENIIKPTDLGIKIYFSGQMGNKIINDKCFRHRHKSKL